ncbi:methyltransferase type 11 [Hyaloraphidium curvatum]|nr:methyltransferase type 11 [Hyaloraphidium curvatum]
MLPRLASRRLPRSLLRPLSLLRVDAAASRTVSRPPHRPVFTPAAMPTHRDLILDQFTLQAAGFNAAAPINDARALAMVIAAGRPPPDGLVVDVACGGGIVACAFAGAVPGARVIGIDVTPAMLERAEERAGEAGLRNAEFRIGDAANLPFEAGSVDVAATRYSFHHFPDPLSVLREMVRIVRPGGRVVVCDMYSHPSADKAAAFNALERLRDPSHVRALALAELRGLFLQAGLVELEEARYEIRDDARNLLARSFPAPGDEEKVLDMFRRSAADGSLGIEVRLEGDAVLYAYPCAVLSAEVR